MPFCLCVLVLCISRDTIGNIAPCHSCLSFALYAFKVHCLVGSAFLFPVQAHSVQLAFFFFYVRSCRCNLLRPYVCVCINICYPSMCPYFVLFVYMNWHVDSSLRTVAPRRLVLVLYIARKVPFFIVPAHLCIFNYSTLVLFDYLGCCYIK